MHVYCTERFKVEFFKLLAKKQYAALEQDLIDYFFFKKIEELISGTNLNNSLKTPYLKKRINGSGGYRVYFLVLIKEENIYLIFVHPKTGPYGASNIKDSSKTMLYKEILEKIKTNDLYVMHVENNKLVYLKKE